MTKKLITLAALAASAVAGTASAQSSLTLFGVVDAAVSYGRASGAGSGSRLQLTNSGYSSSRLGWRGTEDLGGGLLASFWLEAQLANDTGAGAGTNTNNQPGGATPATAQALIFNRRSTVSLAGNWGEVRLGRDYTPQFWNLAIFDPFTLNGVGTTLLLTNIITGVTAGRASNSVGYLLPDRFNGFYGQVQGYLGENARTGASTDSDGNGWGWRAGLARKPFDVAVAYSRTRYAAGDVKQSNIGASWDFGVLNAMAHVSSDRSGQREARGWLLGAVAPVGVGQVRGSYASYRISDPAAGQTPLARKLSLGYVYHLSKRTSLYATWASVRNSGGSATVLNGAVAGSANQASSGLDLGLRHAF